MNQTLTIAKRELSALFFSPVAYLVLAVFSFIATLLFVGGFAPGEPAELGSEMNGIVLLLVFLAPAISMRIISEEIRSGSIELLMTAPLTDTQVIIGKWLGAMGFFLMLLVPIVIHLLVLEIVAEPDYGPMLSGLLGLVLVGGLYLAIGVFVSSFSDSQLIAYIITVLVTGFMTIGMYMLAGANIAPVWLEEMLSYYLKITMHDVLSYLNVNLQYSGFSKGLIDIRNFVFFVSGIALFLFFGVKLLESRRWR
jgi:ABC-2 type transport system permease protein